MTPRIERQNPQLALGRLGDGPGEARKGQPGVSGAVMADKDGTLPLLGRRVVHSEVQARSLDGYRKGLGEAGRGREGCICAGILFGGTCMTWSSVLRGERMFGRRINE